MPPGSDIAGEFRLLTLPHDGNRFDELLASVRWEGVGKGRQGAVLTKVDEVGGVPLVRTTTKYRTPAQRFGSAHERLARQIQTLASLPVAFNNALIENYTNAYASMGGHSDQALDLADGSFIALFSCYQHPERATPPRKIVVEPKAGGETVEVPLTQHSVVVFSVDANRRFRHKIVLDASTRAPENLWLGVTFRTSRTVVRYHDGGAHYADGTRLTLADDEQAREFYGLRRRENMETDFAYPPITYTVSESDLMPPSGNPST